MIAKRLHKYTYFRLVCGTEVVVLVEIIFLNLYFVQATKMFDDESFVENLQEFWEVQEKHFLSYFHQGVKQR